MSDQKNNLALSKQVKELEDALSNIMSALQANQNESQELLFDHCAVAFQIAEKALKLSNNLSSKTVKLSE